MPELPEVELYRQLAERALGRTITDVVADDVWFLKGDTTSARLRHELTGRRFEGARRIGKLLLLDVDDGGPTLGLRFGMTGRLIVDGHAGVDQLIYSSTREEESWDRFALGFDDGGHLRLRDPRRLGGVELDPAEDRLGHDLLSLTPAQLRDALGTSGSPLKARLMDQGRVAGVGNLIADEALWRAGLAPTRITRSLTPAELRRLHRHLRQTVEDLIDRGGSHTGDFHPSRLRGGTCPRDGAPLERATVGGRTTYWCSRHQR